MPNLIKYQVKPLSANQLELESKYKNKYFALSINMASRGTSCQIKPPNISDAVYKEGELIDCFSDFLDKQAEVIQSKKVTMASIAALQPDDQILFEEIVTLFEDYKSDTRSFTIKIRNKLEYILHLHHHQAGNEKLQSEIENLNQIITSDYNSELFERNATKIKIKCDLLLENIRSSLSVSNVLSLREIVKSILAAFAIVACLLLGAFSIATVVCGGVILLVLGATAAGVATGGVGAVVVGAGGLGVGVATGEVLLGAVTGVFVTV